MRVRLFSSLTEFQPSRPEYLEKCWQHFSLRSARLLSKLYKGERALVWIPRGFNSQQQKEIFLADHFYKEG
jgi:hypothetical protein